jgi:hypothetical protein
MPRRSGGAADAEATVGGSATAAPPSSAPVAAPASVPPEKVISMLVRPVE